jgi:hypothetical protein
VVALAGPRRAGEVDHLVVIDEVELGEGKNAVAVRSKPAS